MSYGSLELRITSHRAASRSRPSNALCCTAHRLSPPSDHDLLTGAANSPALRPTAL